MLPCSSQNPGRASILKCHRLHGLSLSAFQNLVSLYHKDQNISTDQEGEGGRKKRGQEGRREKRTEGRKEGETSLYC